MLDGGSEAQLRLDSGALRLVGVGMAMIRP